MKYLMTQEEFEQLIGVQPVPEGVEIPAFTVIYFTASWCGACRRLNMPALEAALPTVNWLKCDIDQNNYTPGYCGVRSIPTFLIVKNKKVGESLQSTSNEKVEAWIRSFM
jgi:thioredoxin-like negative regulator of GroEL